MEPEFGVVMTIVERPDQVEWAVQRLRAVYPDVPLTLISDGRDLPRYPRIAEFYRATYVRGEKLKRLRHGAAWWQRWCEAASTMALPYVLKIDPDTSFNRPFASWPAFDCFGSIACRGSAWEHVQGGIQGFRRTAIERILESGFCLDPAFQRASFWAWKPPCAPQYERTQYLSTDQTMRRILLHLGLTWGSWQEVRSFWRMTPARWQEYAVSHPHKWESPSKRRT